MRAVVALGGNALRRKGEPFDLQTHEKNARIAAESLYEFLLENEVVITHGNGPQVGEEFFRNVFTSGKVFTMSLDYLNAETEGWIGYLLEKSLRNVFLERGQHRDIATLVTLVRVDASDPAFQNPTKYVGRFFSREEAEELGRKYGWTFREDADRGWRVVVPSPEPMEVLNAGAISTLLESGFVVIAAGGGGVPVVVEDGKVKGVEAVIDKDLASARLASQIGADTLIILTEVEKVYLHYGSPQQEPIDRVSVDELERYYGEGHFPPGSMGPKVRAVIDFLRRGGRQAIITSLYTFREALEGKTGTHVLP